MKQEALILIGPPAVGKGALLERFSSTHFTTEMSNLIKASIAADPAFAATVNEIISDGGLIPDDMINPLMGDWLMKVPAFHPIMVDGSCRTRAQTEFMVDQLLTWNFEAVFLVFECPNDDASYSKLYKLCNDRRANRVEEYRRAGKKPRPDDDPVTHKRRFDEYVSQIDHIISLIAHNDAAHVDRARGTVKALPGFHLYFIDASASKDAVLTQVSLHTGVTSDMSKV